MLSFKFSFKMSQYNFKGDITGISERQLEFINNVLKEKKHITEKTQILFEQVGKPGDNYMSVVKRITLEEETGKLSLIAKIAPTSDVIRMTVNTLTVFKNEHTMYMEILPKFTELETEAKIPEEEKFRYAKCYGSFSEAPNEVILLEDLNILNFNILDRFQPLPDVCIKSVLKSFAKFHSLSYALKKFEPEIYDQMKSQLVDIWSVTAATPQIKIYFEKLENEIISILDNDIYKNIVRHKISELANNSIRVTKFDIGSKHSVIQQGDAWTNNIMFKIKDDSDVECVMIDYQISKESSPVADVMYMIFNCTDYEGRSKHFYEWIDYYHNELDKCLFNFGLKINFVYSKDRLEADLKRYGILMFGIILSIANALVRKSQDVQNISNTETVSFIEMVESSKMCTLDDQTNKRFRDRVNGLIKSFTEFGLL